MENDDIPFDGFLGERRSLVLARDYPADSHQTTRQHDVPQLLQSSRGVMRVATPNGYRVVPPGRGVWIPARTPHDIRMVGAVSMCTLYLSASAAPASLVECSVLAIPELLQRLLQELSSIDPRAAKTERQLAIEDLMLLELAHLQRLPFHVSLPRDTRLRKLCAGVLLRPHDSRTLDHHADQVGASTRTLRRLFQQELGMSFAAWRQQVRLTEALARFAEREPIAKVARDLGYAGPSAFIAMFKRSMGQSPRSYLHASARAEEKSVQ